MYLVNKFGRIVFVLVEKDQKQQLVYSTTTSNFRFNQTAINSLSLCLSRLPRTQWGLIILAEDHLNEKFCILSSLKSNVPWNLCSKRSHSKSRMQNRVSTLHFKIIVLVRLFLSQKESNRYALFYQSHLQKSGRYCRYCRYLHT